jgi:hypothetical protein
MRRVLGRGPALFLAAALAFIAPARAAEAFRQIKGPEIKARLTGMELTDGVHWAYVFGRDGRTKSFSLGKPGAGAWSVLKDELCLTGGPGEPGCYHVWMSGQSVQLRREGSIPEEGTLQKPEKRP